MDERIVLTVHMLSGIHQLPQLDELLPDTRCGYLTCRIDHPLHERLAVRLLQHLPELTQLVGRERRLPVMLLDHLEELGEILFVADHRHDVGHPLPLLGHKLTLWAA